jgi:phosphomannomutase / phosphoglucomutase
MQARGEPLAGQPIRDLITVNGVGVTVEDGAWSSCALRRTSRHWLSSKARPEAGMRSMFEAVDRILRENPEVGAYNQTI